MDSKDIIKKPVISEKSALLNDESTYTFVVHPKATKGQIKLAIEKIFKVRVKSINTLKVKGKKRRIAMSRRTYQTADVKKAVVTLKKGEKIKAFETKS